MGSGTDLVEQKQTMTKRKRIEEEDLVCDLANQVSNTAGTDCVCATGYSFDANDVCQEIVEGIPLYIGGALNYNGNFVKILNTDYHRSSK